MASSFSDGWKVFGIDQQRRRQRVVVEQVQLGFLNPVLHPTDVGLENVLVRLHGQRCLVVDPPLTWGLLRADLVGMVLGVNDDLHRLISGFFQYFGARASTTVTSLLKGGR